MAIQVEQVSEMCVRHYSDAGLMLRQVETGDLYPDAVDVIPCAYTYEETDEPVPEVEAEETDLINELIGLGVTF